MTSYFGKKKKEMLGNYCLSGFGFCTLSWFKLRLFNVLVFFPLSCQSLNEVLLKL